MSERMITTPPAGTVQSTAGTSVVNRAMSDSVNRPSVCAERPSEFGHFRPVEDGFDDGETLRRGVVRDQHRVPGRTG